jgi:hypothetical protein
VRGKTGEVGEQAGDTFGARVVEALPSRTAPMVAAVRADRANCEAEEGDEGRSQDGREFDLDRFLPCLLSQAAEATRRSFQAIYKAEYGLRRTQWRVMAHLGKYGL